MFFNMPCLEKLQRGSCPAMKRTQQLVALLLTVVSEVVGRFGVPHPGETSFQSSTAAPVRPVLPPPCAMTLRMAGDAFICDFSCALSSRTTTAGAKSIITNG